MAKPAHLCFRCDEENPDPEQHGCWHYDGCGFCVTCDPASYGACSADCSANHECCTCDEADAACAVHPAEDDEEEDDDDCEFVVYEDAEPGKEA